MAGNGPQNPAGGNPPPKPWERTGSSSGPVPFKPPSSGNTSDVVEASGTANPGEIVSTSDRNVGVNTNALGRPLPSRPWENSVGSNSYGGYGSGLNNSSYGSGMYNSTYGQGGLYGSGGGMYGSSMYRGGGYGGGGLYGSGGLGGGMYGSGLGGGMGGYGMGGWGGWGGWGAWVWEWGWEVLMDLKILIIHMVNLHLHLDFGYHFFECQLYSACTICLKIFNMQGVVNFFGRISILIDQNTQAVHLFMSALLQLFDRGGLLYGELARFAMRLLGLKTKPRKLQPPQGPNGLPGPQMQALEGPKPAPAGGWDNVWGNDMNR
ncbi:hypothetical protein V2J09_005672 [Rumex salicifolius]